MRTMAIVSLEHISVSCPHSLGKRVWQKISQTSQRTSGVSINYRRRGSGITAELARLGHTHTHSPAAIRCFSSANLSLMQHLPSQEQFCVLPAFSQRSPSVLPALPLCLQHIFLPSERGKGTVVCPRAPQTCTGLPFIFCIPPLFMRLNRLLSLTPS